MSPAATAVGLKVVLDKGRRSLLTPQGELRLRQSAFTILLALVEQRGKTVSHEQFIELLGWESWERDEARTCLRAHVKGLRRIVGRETIRTVHWHGYAIDVASIERCPNCGRVA